MKKELTLLFLLISFTLFAQQKVEDDFEGNGTINSWFGDNATINTSFSNIYKQGINTSNTVLQYVDNGGSFANARFDINKKFDLSSNYTFTLKIYVPSSGITGNQNNQVSLKLQNGDLGEPWTTQSEIIKNIVLNQWQTISFDFKNDAYQNYNESLGAPIARSDFDRVLIQVNGEGNTDEVTAYIDDFSYDGTIEEDDPVSNEDYDVLVWADEFDADGAVDNTKWHHQTFGPNGGRWFNNELQHYTDSNTNSFVSNGNLHIVAKKETTTQNAGTDNEMTLDYTSARLNSKFAFLYGRVDVKASLPTDSGTWPAIWTLGKNITEPGAYWQTQGFGTTGWPACGEIDIMEHGLHSTNVISAALHTPASSGATVNTKTKPLTNVTDFHVYSMIWSPESITFLVDDVMYYTFNPETKNSSTWPFDKEQFLLLNLAVGGYSGDLAPDYTESSMIIDYVRVYQKDARLSTSDFDSDKNVFTYPNPVDDSLTIRFKNVADINDAILFDITGKKIHSFQQNKISKKHDVSFLKTGVYFLKLGTSSETKTYKIIKK